MPATAFTRAPKGWTLTEAATLPCAALTAWRALFVDAAIRPGSVVLTQGTGGVSIFALQLAVAAGVTTIQIDDVHRSRRRPRHQLQDRHRLGRTAAEMAGHGVDAVIEVGALFCIILQS